MKRKLFWGVTGVFLVSMVAGGTFAGILARSTISSAATSASGNPSATPSTTSEQTVPAAAFEQPKVDNDAIRAAVEQRKERERIEEEKRRQAEEQRHQADQLRQKSSTAAGTPTGTYATYLGSHNDANRVHNIKLALGSINKMVLLPGETFSFHGAIGDSTNGKLGYKPATVIVGKEYATDYGGGICQVSSTLYNAVARAKLQVTERHSHSLPVDYVPKGQDATVSFPDLDFKFVNSSANPIRIEASLQGDKVVCTIVSVKAN